ncbi:BON domain-containing protein [Pseudomonas mangiferae]|uniref:BON domain-containing protein n=1 Tax=Pseudomonas mangiferae TaxID=2593654 RepID=A0A553H3E0_9PSED|nr:BON domain-containing protein [Pseudomonas mangiferae]TRX76272.1 BON domain-containing protein [Pseudomonas mangiferae]
MKRSPLLVACLAASLVLSGCARTIGKTIDDQFTPSKVSARIAETSPDLKTNSHIIVASYNGVVLLAGQTPTAELKSKAEEAARSVAGVKKLYNELQVMAPSSVSGLARMNDSTITSKLRTQMFADGNIPTSRIKVVTENGVVFLLGLVSRQEAALATNVVQQTSGVQKIVKLFEYTN